MHHLLKVYRKTILSDATVVSAGTREDNVALATARRAGRSRVILPDAPSSAISQIKTFEAIAPRNFFVKAVFPMHP